MTEQEGGSLDSGVPASETEVSEPETSEVEASETVAFAKRCPNVCGKEIDPVFNPGMQCQSQCDQREGHSGSDYCPTHGPF